MISCLLALLGVWVSLTMLGKKDLPCAPIHKAWIVPFGSAGWDYVLTGMVQTGMTRDALTRILGTPDNEFVSYMQPGNVYLVYTNPHNSKRSILIATSKEQKVLFVAHEGPLPAGLQLKGTNAREIMENLKPSPEQQDGQTKD